MKSFIDYISEKISKSGTYAGLRFSNIVNDKLVEFCKNNSIPNSVPPDKIHVTLLYSRKNCPNFKAVGELTTPIICNPNGLVVWETNGENKPKSRCLILKLKSNELVNRHNRLMREHGATFDYPTYEPHTTLSYDIGDMDISHLSVNKTMVLSLVSEYQEDLNTDWASKL